MDLPERIQDTIMPFNVSCGNFLEGFIFYKSAPLGALRAGIDSLTPHGLQHVFGALYLAYIGLHKENFTSVQTWHAAMTMAESAYGVPEAKTDEWERFFVQHWGNNAKLMYRLHDEIAPLFAIKGNSIEISMVWIPLLSAIAKGTESRRPHAQHQSEANTRNAQGKSGCVSVCLAFLIINLIALLLL
jgi:hypothetical protein